MAIISSNIGDNDFSLRKKELRLVDSKRITEEKRNKNLNLARPLTLNEFIGQEQLKSSLKNPQYHELTNCWMVKWIE